MMPRLLARFLTPLMAPFGTITEVATREPIVALTFDDGPDPETTPRFLDVLARHEARATFFMVGQSASSRPALVREIAQAGHAVGNHSWDHPSFPLLSTEERLRQLRMTSEALAPWGRGLFRPPYGHQTLRSYRDANHAGYRVIAWDTVAADWLEDGSEQLYQRVRRRMRPGSIVLFHDTLYTYAEPSHRNRKPTLEAVDRLLGELSGRFRFVSLPELLAGGRAVLRPWFRRPDTDWLEQVR